MFGGPAGTVGIENGGNVIGPVSDGGKNNPRVGEAVAFGAAVGTDVAFGAAVGADVAFGAAVAFGTTVAFVAFGKAIEGASVNGLNVTGTSDSTTPPIDGATDGTELGAGVPSASVGDTDGTLEGISVLRSDGVLDGLVDGADDSGVVTCCRPITSNVISLGSVPSTN